MKKYYITYKYEGGYGATIINSNILIKSYNEIKNITEHISKENPDFKSVIIWDWKLLNESEPIEIK